GVPEPREHDVSGECAAIHATHVALELHAALHLGAGQQLRNHIGRCSQQHRDMHPDDVVCGVAREPLCAHVPAHDLAAVVDHEDGVIAHDLGDETQSFVCGTQAGLDLSVCSHVPQH